MALIGINIAQINTVIMIAIWIALLAAAILLNRPNWRRSNWY